MGYFSEFIKTVNERNISSYIEKHTTDKLLKNKDLRDFITDRLKNTEDIDKHELILFLSKFLKNHIRTTYRCLYDSDKYFIGVDMNVNMYCIYYKSLLVLDIDIEIGDKWYGELFAERKVISKCEKFNKIYGDTYMIFRSKNGYHVFVVNREFDKKSQETIKYMYDFGVDFNYIIFSYVVGYVVRLNRKTEDDLMYSYICTVGNNEKKELADLVEIHIKKTNEYRHILTY
jgi:hypothetical protein